MEKERIKVNDLVLAIRHIDDGAPRLFLEESVGIVDNVHDRGDYLKVTFVKSPPLTDYEHYVFHKNRFRVITHGR